MRHYGIIGNPLEHSFSPAFFTQLFEHKSIDAGYTKLPLLYLDDIKTLDIDGFNVTYPYKTDIIPFLDELDDTAVKIGAVNTVKRIKTDKGYILKGYNTDCTGFEQAIEPLIKGKDIQALILGTGGAAKAVAYAFEENAIPYTFVSRNKKNGMTYNSLNKEIISEHKLIVQATPLGMYPKTCSAPDIPYEYLTKDHIAFDCIYNPPETLFLKKAKQAGATTENGLNMLICQARAAWQIWNQ